MFDKNKFFQGYEKYLPLFIITLTIIYLINVLNLSYWTDIKFRNIFGLNDWLTSTYENEYPMLWIQMFREGSPTEYLQWFYLGTAVVLCFILFLFIYRRSASFPWGWLLLVKGLGIMFLEDVINLRHKLSGFVAADILEVTSRAEFFGDPRRSYIELSVYLVLGIIMIVALIYILKDKKTSYFGKKLLLAGYILYGTAALASATRHLGEWYTRVGQEILLRLYPDNWASFLESNHIYGFMFMDYLVEESVELLGAAFLLAAIVAFTAQNTKKTDAVEPASNLHENTTNT